MFTTPNSTVSTPASILVTPDRRNRYQNKKAKKQVRFDESGPLAHVIPCGMATWDDGVVDFSEPSLELQIWSARQMKNARGGGVLKYEAFEDEQRDDAICVLETHSPDVGRSEEWCRQNVLIRAESVKRERRRPPSTSSLSKSTEAHNSENRPQLWGPKNSFALAVQVTGYINKVKQAPGTLGSTPPSFTRGLPNRRRPVPPRLASRTFSQRSAAPDAQQGPDNTTWRISVQGTSQLSVNVSDATATKAGISPESLPPSSSCSAATSHDFREFVPVARTTTWAKDEASRGPVGSSVPTIASAVSTSTLARGLARKAIEKARLARDKGREVGAFLNTTASTPRIQLNADAAHR